MENEKKKPEDKGLSTIVEMQRKIRQLEFMVNYLQQRLGGIAASYELEIAVAKSELEMNKLYGDTAEEVD
jgi:hypothetical protein